MTLTHREKLKQAGGSVIYEKQAIPDLGWSVLAVDPGNNVLGLFQPTRAPPAPKRAPVKKKSKPAKKEEQGQKEVATLLLFLRKL
ncbi:MAG: VOC family protein [Nitrososphaerales archaeon]